MLSSADMTLVACAALFDFQTGAFFEGYVGNCCFSQVGEGLAPERSANGHINPRLIGMKLSLLV